MTVRSFRVRHQTARTVLAVLAAVLPRGLRRLVHVRLLGYRLDPTASIGHAIIDVDELTMGPDTRIGHLVLIRGCELVQMGPFSEISRLVWVNSVRRSKGYFPGIERQPALIMGKRAIITMLHFIDACDLVEFEDFAVLAGFASIVQTHAVDFDTVKQACAPVRFRTAAMVASRCLLLPGSEVPAQSMVAAGSVVTRKLEGHHLFAGVPARPIRTVDPEAPFFNRGTSQVR